VLIDQSISRRRTRSCETLRSHRGLSGRDLAAAAGVSAPFVSEIESGKKDASLSVMKKIADVLKVDLDDLV
jgi:transcriptional regulator with XRE-family HTH domain